MRFRRGVTLFEVIIYLALFSILIGGAVLCAYNLFSAAANGSTRIMLEEESNFLLAKVEYELANASSIAAPIPREESSLLRGSDKNGTFEFTTSESEFTLNGRPISNSNVRVEYLHFSRVEIEGNGYSPEYLETVLVLSAKTPSGVKLLHFATSTYFLSH